MATVFKQIFVAPVSDGTLFEPYGYVTLGDYGIRDGNPLITAQLTQSEIDGQINFLIRDLEKLRKEMKASFRKAKERIHT